MLPAGMQIKALMLVMKRYKILKNWPSEGVFKYCCWIKVRVLNVGKKKAAALFNKCLNAVANEWPN